MNRFHVAPFAALALFALLTGCNRGGAPEEAFPQAAADGWKGSFNGGDVAGLVLVYSSDAKILPPDEPFITGAKEIEKFWTDYRPGQVRLDVGEVQSTRIGEYWYREGTYKAQFQDEGEPRVGKFIELWKKENGNWVMYRQMWNRNAPLAPTEQPAAGDDGAA